jgi:hypothetical protein
MPTIASVIWNAATALVAVILLLDFLDEFIGERNKDKIRQKITDFWAASAELETSDKVHAALSRRYGTMKRSQYRFIRFFLANDIDSTAFRLPRIYDTRHKRYGAIL